MLSLVAPPDTVPSYKLFPVALPKPDEIMAYATMLYNGGLQNKHCNSPAKVAVRIAAGMELGLNPIQSVNWIAIINGRAVIWGDAALALIRRSGLLEDFQEYWVGEGPSRVAVCVSKRKGASEPRETRFSVDDAKTAKLWDKEGPWQEYPDRQLMWRARGWNLRDNFGDVLCGLGIAEEELDVPVKAMSVTADKPATPPGLAPKAPPAAAEAQPACPADLLDRIADARHAWLERIGVEPADDDAVAREWRAKLAPYGVTSATQLPPDQAARLLAELLEPPPPPTERQADQVFGPAADAPAETPPGN